MSKLLNLTLHYQGKVLDRVRYGKDFKSKFFIGSNKYLFWQILDESFPDKHLFIAKKGDQLYLQLPPGAKISCSKEGKPVDNTFLQSNYILQENKLLLAPDMTGTLSIAPDWEISYEFKEPYIAVLTPEQQQLAAQFARRPQPTAIERFNRNLILLFILLTAVFVIIFDLFLKKQITYDTTLEQKIKTVQNAERIQAEALAKPSTFEEAGEVAELPKETATGKETQGVTGGVAGGTGTAKSAGAIFGSGIGSFNPSATSLARPIYAVTIAEGFTTSRAGGGGGGGTGPGGGGAGSGIGGGYGTSFNPNAPRTSAAELGSVATKAPGKAGSDIRPQGVAIASARGDLSKLEPSGVAFGQTAQTSQLISSYKSKNVTKVTEETIAQAPASSKTMVTTVRDIVNSKKGQIQALYSKWNALQRCSGSVSIRLLINSSGKVQDAIITPNGSFPHGFLTELEQLCESFSFPITQELDYTFKHRLGSL